MTKPVTNFAASARARLLAVTKQRKDDFQLTLQRYVVERFLYRLGVSRYRDRFVLKGAMLFMLWHETGIRPTRDLDLAGYWSNDATSLAAAVGEICAIAYPQDGVEFSLKSIRVAPIRGALEYHGFRVNLEVHLAAAVIPLQIDVGLGDLIVPEPVEVIYPVLLDGEPPRIRAYPREASIAEKLHAMVSHGEVNSRLKDFFDVYALSSVFTFQGSTMTAAIAATFSRRQSASFSPWPVALTTDFYTDPSRCGQWDRYLVRTKLANAPADFGLLGERVREFLEAPARAVSEGRSFTAAWPPGGPWQ
jgi:hypothetical protein